MHVSREDYKHFHRRRHAVLVEALARHMPEKVARSLDVGGGGDIGGMAAIIRNRFAEDLHGVDQGDDVARGRDQGIHSEECNVDHDALPFEDGYFGLAVLASVIEHLYNPHRALAELTRVLTPGGLFLVEAPNAVSLGRRLDLMGGQNPFRFFNGYNAQKNKAFMVNCSVFYTCEEVVELLEPNFTILEQGYAMHSPKQNPLKAAIRETASRLFPRTSDCFYVLARKR